MKILLIAMLLVSSMLAEIVVIVNPVSKVKNLNASYVKKVFMKKIKSLPNGEILVPIDQNYESEIYRSFYESIASKTPGRMSKYWAKLNFTGRGEAPKVVASDSDVIRMVMNNTNMVGYIDSESLNDGVKVIYTLD